MYSSSRINLEIFRDYATPDVSVDDIVNGLVESAEIIPQIEIIDHNRKINTGPRNSQEIITKNLRLPQLRADMGMIVTSRRLVVPNSDGRVLKGNIVVGSTWPYAATPFSILDANGMSPRITAKHELGHLMQIPREGEYFDGDCHCTDDSCLMHAIIRRERENYCDSCQAQLARSALRLIEYKSA